MQHKRNEGLDALRGLAILLMVFSGTIPFAGALPAWMYHAQTPPPTHVFNPSLPGITWVDLVFPFFIFSMGAALPLAIGNRLGKGESVIKLIVGFIKRFFLLTLFAWSSFSLRPWNIKSEQKWYFAVLGFIFCFAVFGTIKTKDKTYLKAVNVVNIASLFLMILMLVGFNVNGILELSLSKYDIIIQILASLALVGSLLYLIVRNSKSQLWGILGVLVLFYIGYSSKNSWLAEGFNLQWLSPFVTLSYLQYLIILIPGIYAGNLILEKRGDSKNNNRKLNTFMALLLVTMVVINVVLLYTRWQKTGLLINVIFAFLVFYRRNTILVIIGKYCIVGAIFVVVGYLIEPFQGGIKKDPATISYLLLTPGLAFWTLGAFHILLERKSMITGLLCGAGKNPLMAYILGSNLVVPLMVFSGLEAICTQQNGLVWLQVAKAVFITVTVAFISQWFARKKVFWKT